MFNKLHVVNFPLILLLSIIMVACGADDKIDEAANKEDTEIADEVTEITIGMDPYDYVELPTYLGKKILEDLGYTVNVEVADIGILYSTLADKEVDVFPDVWEPNLHSNYLERYEDEIEIIGPLYEESPLGIAVPEYMEEVNSIEDLITHQAAFDGEIYGIEAGTGMNLGIPIMFDMYDMDYEMIESSTEGMLGEVGHKIAKEEPIAFAAWRPHTMFDEYDIKLLEDPKGAWSFDTVHVGVTKEFKEESPTAYTLFSNMNFTNEEVEDWMVQLRDTNKDAEELVIEWMDEHPDRVEGWLNP